ncbi:MAG: 4Fe-4S dicluster domain-containing protein [Candidatus Ratteibacteria bacterium]
MKRILIKEEFCIGCRLCEIHCITTHSKTKDIIKAYKMEKTKPLSGIYFEEIDHISFAVQCRHCEDATCVASCLTGAMYRDENTNLVLHNKDKCVGCWMCVMVCPLGVIKIDLKNKKVASKCDLCIENQFPACVENCPNEALILVNDKGEKIEK